MDTIAQSFASLVKTNNGFFKSIAQANFLLSQSSYDYISCGSVMGNSFNMHYTCDDQGVTLVRKYTKAKGFVTAWERNIEGVVSLQDAKEIKRLARSIKEKQNSITSHQASFDAGTYDAPRNVFDSMMEADKKQLIKLIMMSEDTKNGCRQSWEYYESI